MGNPRRSSTGRAAIWGGGVVMRARYQDRLVVSTRLQGVKMRAFFFASSHLGSFMGPLSNRYLFILAEIELVSKTTDAGFFWLFAGT
jgi:hypothetical protein